MKRFMLKLWRNFDINMIPKLFWLMALPAIMRCKNIRATNTCKLVA
jgi:hypothetical protein